MRRNETYVRELLYQESLIQNGYPSESGVRKNWYSGNDYYKDILINRENQVKKLEMFEDKINAYIAKLDDGDLKEKLKKHVKKITKRKESLKNFGYESINYSYSDGTNVYVKYPLLEKRKNELANRFKWKYGNMRIAYNTAEQFNERLQGLFDDIAPEYENRLRLQALYEKEILDENFELRNLDVRDISNTENGVSTFRFNDEEPTAKAAHKTLENVSKVKSTSETIQSRVKNIMSGYMINQTILKDYLEEFGVLFIRVWGDRTRW